MDGKKAERGGLFWLQREDLRVERIKGVSLGVCNKSNSSVSLKTLQKAYHQLSVERLISCTCSRCRRFWQDDVAARSNHSFKPKNVQRKCEIVDFI